ncbi:MULTISPECIES: bifunctional [glutamine synthetase] adenylyltransferase/[glutamine synthetase]-adenylyl-L-tyrosine phosphorylase [unclassified Actinobaculum]|uniref:bifunctional [glutamine synthetase] adenylyltransferase/[glutamine synthetase]-adenylyl-L-tyrosine phosphorylase n=1 Tax=unclassified Actinobaculum TaxID=2609299 RepID=UPI000D529140|nr:MULTISPECIES: bifunctional [glutamine synthetase] adenylyltransferase/[glutamine synthetase]-adenylyl-L-tyrosine phosphorylase [unclassified Actinobaculum]AWE42549.1 bifunctional glutamine-synthetase adenylyltransferase/deadenyltransferase [Actinobaculum sp. 313]RTE48771.1 bifunctional [glutamine synthetase] adenylyltransferase/[glutamine synthetase]-adenylyl-L-tyrosine phosphorylase [Actinobaculum sp. 352]
MRQESLATRLRRAGFTDPARAARLLDDPASAGLLASVQDSSGDGLGQILGDFAAVADPDACLLALIRLAEACDKDGSAAPADSGGRVLLREIVSDPARRKRLLAVLGMSSALGDFLIAHPAVLASLDTDDGTARAAGMEDDIGGQAIPSPGLAVERARALRAVDADEQDEFPCARMRGAAGISALRAHYFSRIVAVAAADLTCADPLAAVVPVGESIADIVGGTLEAALALARAETPGAEHVGLAIIALGKTGARELNYISDVDVVYVVRALDETTSEEEVIAVGTRLASFVGRAVAAPAGEPALWMLDAALRPEGKDGPLVRTLDSHAAYYRRWAKGWEFQALLKARPIAGDHELGAAYIESIWHLVWSAAGRENFVEDSRAMRKRVEEHVPAREEGRQLKLGKGGLRDVEFTVQLLQLVHGRTDETLRVRSTLAALTALRDGGYVSRSDAAKLDADYRLLRVLEHRIQLQHLRRSHLLPAGVADLRRVARAMRCGGIATGEDLETAWQHTRREVRSLHQEIYYRPLLPEAAKLSPDDISLHTEAAEARLAAIGYRDPHGALRHIDALTSGVSRYAAIQRQLLPVMLGWFTEGPEPDAGLLAFRLLSEKMGRTSWYMRTLRDGGAAAQRLCYVLSSSRYVATQIPNLAESIGWLEHVADLHPRSRDELNAELASMLSRRSDPTAIAQAGRYLRRRELLRVGLAQTLRVIDPPGCREAISHAADIALEAGLRAGIQAAQERLNEPEALSRYLVVAMGRMGGEEMGYISDADVLFVHEPFANVDPQRAQRLAVEVAVQTRRLLAETGSEPPLAVDTDLRPEGRNGALSRSWEAYAEYYQRWAQTWEIQALLRARYGAGDHELGERFLGLINAYRYPVGGISQAQIREIRLMKARVEMERIPRGVDPQHHLKLGRGGLSDVEWTAQLLQLRYAGEHEALRCTSTLGALAGAARVGILSDADEEMLREAWSFASQLRDVNFLGTGRAFTTKISALPHDSDELAVVTALLGWDAASRHEVEESYLRLARRCRAVVERVFYGNPSMPSV